MSSSISLDLMELDGKVRPVEIVDEILRQNPDMPYPVPLEELATAVGIQQIGELVTEGFEGMLMTNPEKSQGVIMVKANANPQRRRFTIGHELGHYLLPWHRQLSFSCSSESIKDSGTDSKSAKGVEMEAEANTFASELLMPSAVFKKLQRNAGEPDIEQVVKFSAHFDASVEATARRFMNLSDYPVAFVFSLNDTVRYWTKGPEFPYLLSIKNGQQLPKQSSARGSGQGIGEMEELDGYIWLSDARGPGLPDKILEQTLHQQDGYKVTMLYVEEMPDEDEDEDDE
ncbi:ImmA/IrrE family metallo-endopeptidase [Dechloromonas hortensis]|uniref:ImmA/IrrE family metallo-endopeptidase n=1 Tax=Dechloromonas hortensis TaxID=337779 RepID=UPI001291F98F|nr:ImmA/IrrE family metallo-endopeptidase [Dechloromonas hortensis]